MNVNKLAIALSKRHVVPRVTNNMRVMHTTNRYMIHRIPNMQIRQFQSDSMRESPGFLDSLIGTYDDPNYTLDLKPEEWREGQYKHYMSWSPINEWGIFMIGVPSVAAFVMCFAFLAYYTFYDTQVTVLRDNPLSFLEIKNGADLYQNRNPLYMWMYPFAWHKDLKVMFYFEIEDAMERKKSGNY